jgi:hypothetical protein
MKNVAQFPNDGIHQINAFLLAFFCWFFEFMIFWRERMNASYIVLLTGCGAPLFIWCLSLVKNYIQHEQYDFSDTASRASHSQDSVTPYAYKHKVLQYLLHVLLILLYSISICLHGLLAQCSYSVLPRKGAGLVDWLVCKYGNKKLMRTPQDWFLNMTKHMLMGTTRNNIKTCTNKTP